MRALLMAVIVLGSLLLAYSGFQFVSATAFHRNVRALSRVMTHLEQQLSESAKTRDRVLDDVEPFSPGGYLEERAARFPIAWFFVACSAGGIVVVGIKGVILEKRSSFPRSPIDQSRSE